MPVLGGSQALGTTNEPWLGYEAKKYRWPRWQAPGAEWGATDEICMDCDGCGWTEGGKCLMTTCTVCGGTGKVSCQCPARPRRNGK